MGKNFSCNNVDGKRRVADAYSTPYSLTRLFLDTGALDPHLHTVEPAEGEGAITKVLAEYGFSDVDGFDLETGTDFLATTGTCDQIITNPPYSIAFEFVQHAKEIATKRFAMLLPLAYLHGKKRYDEIWQDIAYPLKGVYVFTRYPHLGDTMRPDGKTTTGMMVYAWYVWEKSFCGYPEIHWLDNNAYIVKKGE